MAIEIKMVLTDEDIDRIANAVIEKNKVKETVQKLENINYTVKDVAKFVKKNKITIRSHIKLGLLEANKIGNTWIITKESLNKYIGNE